MSLSFSMASVFLEWYHTFFFALRMLARTLYFAVWHVSSSLLFFLRCFGDILLFLIVIDTRIQPPSSVYHEYVHCSTPGSQEVERLDVADWSSVQCDDERS